MVALNDMGFARQLSSMELSCDSDFSLLSWIDIDDEDVPRADRGGNEYGRRTGEKLSVSEGEIGDNDPGVLECGYSLALSDN